MRQKDGLSFADMLWRIPTDNWNDHDIAMLKSRVVSVTDPSYPQDALHAFAFNKVANEHNMKKTNELAAEKVVIYANDDKYDSTGAKMCPNSLLQRAEQKLEDLKQYYI